ncbi:MAG: ComF family protein [Gammaproteobacteria bacterium]|nr:ComF family protein [Gammaproteobacteria bacterium]MDH3362083.1 ComF family protein [Gammaproteobacteria bacterium]MDH3481288.1 ComF family protein [Gammaproteobacteria bacterium]
MNTFMEWRALLHACRTRTAGLLRELDDSIMPLRCVFCGTATEGPERRICSGCRGDLPWMENACARCGAAIAVDLPRGVHCAACQARPPPVLAMVVPLRYEFPVDAGLKALKFGRRLQYAPAFGELLLAEMARLPADIDALLPVPLHWRRQAFRGFNQARELCRPLARHCALPIMTGVSRRRPTPFQSGLAATQRRKNLRRAFLVRKTSGFQHVLIVDDVVTTGETTRQLATALIRGGVKKVSVLAVARAV